MNAFDAVPKKGTAAVKMWTKKWQRRAEVTGGLHKRSRAAMEASERCLARFREVEAEHLAGTDWPDELEQRLAVVVRSWAAYADALLDRLEQVDAA